MTPKWVHGGQVNASVGPVARVALLSRRVSVHVTKTLTLPIKKISKSMNISVDALTL